MSLFRPIQEPDRTMQVAAGGSGLYITWLCMGCNKRRPSLGSRGHGLRLRCGECIKAKEAKQ